MRRATLATVQRALELAGVAFIDDKGRRRGFAPSEAFWLTQCSKRSLLLRGRRWKARKGARAILVGRSPQK